MKVKLIDYTPLSVAIIAGRSAWNSFHKGGNYSKPTDNITKDDYNFLNRLFNKFKHVSVSEHIFYEFEIEYKDKNELISILAFNDGYFLPSINDNKVYITTTLRWFYENNAPGFLIDVLPELHKNLLHQREYTNSLVLEKDFTTKVEENDLGHKVILLYKSNNWVNLRIQGFSRALLQEIIRHDDFRGVTIKSTRYTLKELKNEKSFLKYKDCKDVLEGVCLDYDFERAKKYIVLTGNDYVDKNNVYNLETLRKAINENISNDIIKYLLPEAYRTEGVFSFHKRNLNNLLKLRLSKDALWEFQELAKLINNVAN